MSAKPKAVIVALLLILSLVAGGCVVADPTPAQTPEYHNALFVVGKDDWSPPIYLRNNEILHLMWRVEGSQDEVWFDIITPSGKTLGFYEADGQYADGTLEDGFCRGMTSGMTQFSPSDYGWGEGYYIPDITAYGSEEPITVRIEYWIEAEK